ncbi:MAG: MFS transporter [Alphaproteobacteria bacterium]|nr:MAG: MFS transporter [Alphaproteobacteria bacterium]
MPRPENWRTPETMLLAYSVGWYAAFAVWMALLNNFAVDSAHFTGREIGILQSLREIPGFMAFSVIFVLLFISEQRLLMISLLIFGIGVAITGLFPSEYGLYFTTILMSIGFHYGEALKQSLTLQLVSKDRAPIALGNQISAGAFASIAVYGAIYVVTRFFDPGYEMLYAAGGALAVLIGICAWIAFPTFNAHVVQSKKLIMRKRYWLFYALTFLAGARRQIFVVFAGFMMVEKFGYGVSTITLLYLVNYGINIFLAPKIGKMIARLGEKRALIVEYSGLILVFTGYALVENATFAACLYVIDHLFFAFAIGIKSYFQKIADPQDVAATTGVSFTINHIAAVVIPVVFGFLWMASPASVFLAGTTLAVCSLIFALNIPRHPCEGNETLVGPRFDNAGKAIKVAAE